MKVTCTAHKGQITANSTSRRAPRLVPRAAQSARDAVGSAPPRPLATAAPAGPPAEQPHSLPPQAPAAAAQQEPEQSSYFVPPQGLYWGEEAVLYRPARRHMRRRGWITLHELPAQAAEAAASPSQAGLLELTQQQLRSMQQAVASVQQLDVPGWSGQQLQAAASSAQQQLSQLSHAVSSAAPTVHLPDIQQQLVQLQQLTACQLTNLQRASSAAASAAAQGGNKSRSSGGWARRQLRSMQQGSARAQQLSPVRAYQGLEQQLSALADLTTSQLSNLQQAVASLHVQQEEQQQAKQLEQQQQQQAAASTVQGSKQAAPAQRQQARQDHQARRQAQQQQHVQQQRHSKQVRQAVAQRRQAAVAVQPGPGHPPQQLLGIASQQPLLAHRGWALLLAAVALGWGAWRAVRAMRRSSRSQRQHGSHPHQEIQEAEARARAARQKERSRQRFQRALVAAEDFEASSIDNSVFSAVSMRGTSARPPAPAVSSLDAIGAAIAASGLTSKQGSISSTPPTNSGNKDGGDGSSALAVESPPSAPARIGAAADADNPFLRSMQGVAFTLDEELPLGALAGHQGSAGAAPLAGAAEEAAEGEEEAEADTADADGMDAETRKAWEAFVRSSKVGQGKMWDANEVDEFALPEVWVDLNKE